MHTLPILSPDAFQLVLNALNLTIAFMGGAALLFALLRSQVAPAYRLGVAVMAAAVGMAAYHYLRLFENWNAAYTLQNGAYQPTGTPFNDAFRYADWIGTVPLILTALMLVLDVGRTKSRSLIARLVAAALAMIVLGYFGEVQRTDMGARMLWFGLSCAPFVYILYVLWSEMSSVLTFETPRVRELFSQTRALLLASWSLHPLVYLFPVLGFTGPLALVVGQVGHSVADISAKVMFGFLIYAIAAQKTRETAQLEREGAVAPVAAAPVPTPLSAPAVSGD